MLLDDLAADPARGWAHLERYVNDGSPSGFTDVHRPPERYDPRASVGPFALPVLNVPAAQCTTFGSWPTGIADDADDTRAMPVHPLVLEELGEKRDELLSRTMQAEPTASARTVILIETAARWHVKLHYPGVLGRVRRELPEAKAVAGVENSMALLDGIALKLVDPRVVGVLPEVCARAWICADSSIGAVLRSPQPTPAWLPGHTLVPIFSMFARDRAAKSDPSLVEQLVQHCGWTENRFLNMMTGIIDAYVATTFTLGLMPELNAQNGLLEFDEHFSVCRPVLRDLSRFEKILDIRRARGLDDDFRSVAYKALDATQDLHYARLRHSFSFDFKLSHYVIKPLCVAAGNALGVPSAQLIAAVRAYVDRTVGQHYSRFPDSGAWYSHPKVMLTEQRPYREHREPLLRSA